MDNRNPTRPDEEGATQTLAERVSALEVAVVEAFRTLDECHELLAEARDRMAAP